MPHLEMTTTLERIQASLVGLKMARALEALGHIQRRIEQGEIGALEAIDALLGRAGMASANHGVLVDLDE